MAMHEVLHSGTTDGSGSALNLAVEKWTGGAVHRWMTCKLAVQVAGTFDGATVTIEGSLDDGTTYSPLANGEFTEEEIRILDTPPILVRATISGAGASTDLEILAR